MERKEILEKVSNLISKVAEVDKNIIKEESLLNADLEVESLDLMDLVVEFEKEFNVTISDKQIKKFQTVKDIVDYIEQNV